MAKLVYEWTLSRQVEIDVPDEQVELVRKREPGSGWEVAMQAIGDLAAETLKKENPPAEWISSTCVDENDNELFDIG